MLYLIEYEANVTDNNMCICIINNNLGKITNFDDGYIT